MACNKVNIISKQYLPFEMPFNYTVRSKHPEKNLDGFKLYAENMENLCDKEFERTILAAIHGETRVQAAQMEIDVINDDRDEFRKTVIDVVQNKLGEVGIEIVNANIAELKETERNGQMGYLAARERKKLSQAVQQSEIDVAEATRIGDIGKKERKRDTQMSVAAMNASAILRENENQQEIAKSKADLAVVQAEFDRISEISKLEAIMAEKDREIELQREINTKNIFQEHERLRALNLSSAKVEAESLIAKMEGDKTSIEMLADARLYCKQKKADAQVYTKKQEAVGILSVLQAQADGLKELHESSGNDSDLTKFFLMKEMLPKLVEENAKSVQGLNPEIKI
jgi:flotillin